MNVLFDPGREGERDRAQLRQAIANYPHQDPSRIPIERQPEIPRVHMNADGDFIEKPFDLDIRPLAKLRGWKMADEVPEMVERVAKAIWENGTPLKAGPWDDDLQLWERADDQEKQICRLQAIAAIAALREPTEVMIKAGDRNVIGGEESACLCAADTIYQAMIDEALK